MGPNRRRTTMTAPEAESIRVQSGPARQPAWRAQVPVVAVVALGGALGATARYALSLGWPTPPGGFPWTTFWTNVSGCAVIGAFMVVITEVWAAHRLVRPFFGTGVLGGFTTFSTYAVEIRRLADAHQAGTAAGYAVATLASAPAAGGGRRGRAPPPARPPPGGPRGGLGGRDVCVGARGGGGGGWATRRVLAWRAR